MHLITKVTIPLVLMSGLAYWPLQATRTDLGVIKEDARTANPTVVDNAPNKGAKTPLSDEEIAQAASTIDTLINKKLEEKGLKALPQTNDEQFLRRVYLDLAGRIPTVEEAGTFLGSRSKDKREKLIKELLASDAHAHHMFSWWADLLRASSRLQDRYTGAPYIDWIKNSIKSNKPFDKMVYELITAQGPALARGNGATGYYVADKGMPEDNMANTVRIFLGTRLACAQCHDHPFDKWTRKDFFEMVAFTDGVETFTPTREFRNAVTKMGGKNVLASTRTIAQRFAETVGMEVKAGKGGGSVALPKDYQYKDARPGQKINALTMFEEDILKDGSKSDARDTYAKWMTSPDNPRFALVIANRMWQKLMKVGLVEPLDDFMDDTTPSNKELADFLTQLMISVKFDLRKFQEIVASSNAYQREAITEDENRMDFHYHGMPLHRLTAEQVWDSLMTLTVPNIDKVKGEGAEHQYKLYEENKNKSPEQLAEIVLKAGEARERVDAIKQELTALREQMKKSNDRAKYQAKYDQLRKEQDRLRDEADPTGYSPNRYNGLGPLRRAAELSSPTPPSHFLRVFGQSDRYVINNATDALNLTQALDLMNGMVEEAILGDPKSVLSQQLEKAKTANDKVKMIYLAVLSRMPTSREMSFGNRVMSLVPNKRGPEYLSWALINSAEFMFNQ